MSNDSRFVIKREQPGPDPRPRWWQGRWEVWDTLYDERVIGFATNGMAWAMCRFLNDPTAYQGRPPALTASERWGWSS